MKVILSKISYCLGHFVSILIRCGFLSFLYPVYRKLMLWSCDLDRDGKVWKIVKKRKLHELNK
jgi:hypothetical protein